MKRAMLHALTPLYAAGAAAKNTAYDRGWSRAHRLRWPVISIGNLSVGGAGKTPLVIHLAALLRAQGLHVDVLTRGYGRNSTATEQVDAAGSAARYGDEPLLIANRAGVPVFVSADRYQAGLLAEQNITGPAVHLLDDGFQHRRLARAVDIVVLHRSDFDQRLLPAGRLREPLSSLSRATAVVLREEDAALASALARRGIHRPVWHVVRTLSVPEVKGKTVAFCGIARPDEFFTALHAENIVIAEARAFRDHHPYGETEIARLAELAREHKATAFLTTEKDAIRMGPELRARLAQTATLHVARLDLALRDEARVVADLLERVHHGNPLT